MRLDAPLPPWWRNLFTLRRPVPDEVIDTIVGAGDGGLRALCAVFEPELGERPVPSPSHEAPELCAALLREFARPALAPWLLERMRERGGDDPATPMLAETLARCGPSVLFPICEWFAETEPGAPIRPWLAETAAHTGARTDEALAVLVSYLADAPLHGAQLLGDYGDPAAAAALLVEFDRSAADEEDGDSATIVTLGETIRALGGELGPSRSARLLASHSDATEAATEQRRQFIERGGFGSWAKQPEPGDPCPCDSGREYAECCAELEADLAERHRLRGKVPNNY